MKIKIFLLNTCFILFFNLCVSAHIPYFEHRDYSEEKPFVVRKIVIQSKALYSWLESDGLNPCKDLDVYRFTLNKA